MNRWSFGYFPAMRVTRHIPEVRGVVTLHCDADGWRAELNQAGETEFAPLPCRSAGEALHGLGLDEGAVWATELAAAARHQQAAAAAAATRRV